MRRIRENPEVAEIVRHYVEDGGTLFAFVGEEGEYGPIFGGSLRLKADKATARFAIAPGDVPSVELKKSDKRASVQAKRALPSLDKGLDPGWRVVAYTEGRKGPRILERGASDNGGYVVVWLDRPALFRSRLMGDRIPTVEETRAKVESYVMRWARYLAYRRYDQTGEELRKARLALTPGEAVTVAERKTAAPAAAVPPAGAADRAARLKDLEHLKKEGLLTAEEYGVKRAQILGEL